MPNNRQTVRSVFLSAEQHTFSLLIIQPSQAPTLSPSSAMTSLKPSWTHSDCFSFCSANDGWHHQLLQVTIQPWILHRKHICSVASAQPDSKCRTKCASECSALIRAHIHSDCWTLSDAYSTVQRSELCPQCGAQSGTKWCRQQMLQCHPLKRPLRAQARLRPLSLLGQLSLPTSQSTQRTRKPRPALTASQCVKPR